MDESQTVQKPVILLFDEHGRPLMVRMPPRKQPIGFINGIKFEEEKETSSAGQD